MAENENPRLKLIQEMEEFKAMLNPLSIVGPSYRAIHKQLGDLYLGEGEELKGIYNLTESHSATLRQQFVIRYDYKEDLISNKNKTTTAAYSHAAHGIKKEYIEFGNNMFHGEEGLLSRLREMPKEWTVVQLTKQCSPKDMFLVRPKDYKISGLHIIRMPCGAALDESCPVSVLVGPPRHSEGMPTLFDVMEESIKLLRSKNFPARQIRTFRKTASDNIQSVTEGLSTDFLKEWRCLLLGTLSNSRMAEKVKTCINTVLSSAKHQNYTVDSRSYELLYRVADAAVHLTSPEIKSAVSSVVDSKHLFTDLVSAIETFKEENLALLAARRNPVILLVDEELDSFSWEMMAVLKRHPVSRMPSIHFLHALYHEHKDHIVDGCREVTKLDVGYYIVNPDGDLNNMESRLMKFLERRLPRWKGLKGAKPSEETFCKALVENNVFVYCGHHNGTHFLRPEDISILRVIALPLLFGCASVALQDLGGDIESIGVAEKYIMAGSACILGMQWTVTCDDTDCMTVMLLNNWLPGGPIDLKGFRKAGDMLNPPKEPELLRLLRHAREVAHLYSNTAALIARGIPVRMVE